MTAAAVALSGLLSFAGFVAFALSLDRHHRAIFRSPVPRRRAVGLRSAGWSGLALAFAASVAAGGWDLGPVQWVGALTGSALVVVALLSYRPAWLRAAALVALPLAALALPLALMR